MQLFWEKLTHFAFFAGQTAVILIALIVLISFIFNLVQKNKQKVEIEIKNLNERYARLAQAISLQWMNKKELKKFEKAEKKRKAELEKNRRPHTYVIDFDGDVKAESVSALREEVSAILAAAQDNDEVVVLLESPGGVVHGYGLAAAQLMRIKQKGLRLTACVDKVAASGGYMMACVADHIVAAPFAILGSIGVLAQIPNFHKLLKKNDIDYQEITAGDYKRTLTLFGEVTEKGKQKFTEQIVDTHELFKSFVLENRPAVEISQVATGEYWFARRAIDLKLVDEIMTSDQYLTSLVETRELLQVKYETKKKWTEKLAQSASLVLEKAWDHWLKKASTDPLNQS